MSIDEIILDEPNSQNQLTINKLITMMTIGRLFYSTQNHQILREKIVSFNIYSNIILPTPEMNEYQREQLRIMFITKLDQCIEKKYVLIFVSLFNFGILLQRSIDMIDSSFHEIYLNQHNDMNQQKDENINQIETKQSEIMKQLKALKIWTSRISPFLTEEFISLLNEICEYQYPNQQEFSKRLDSLSSFFHIGDDELQKWFIQLQSSINKLSSK